MSALTSQFGRYNPAGRCWMASATSENGPVRGCIAIRQATDIDAPEGKRTYLLLEGPGEQDCHACQGLIAFAVFDQAPGWRLAAHSPAKPDGIYGVPTEPKYVPFRKLGPAQWGWIEESGNAGQGYVDSVYTVWLPHAATVQQAGVLPGSHSNTDTAECTPPVAKGTDCYDLKITYHVDSRQMHDDYYAIVLTATGRKGGRQLSAQAASWFDLGKFAYQTPSPPLP